MSLELALQQATAAFQLNTALLQQLIAILAAENTPAITAPAAEDLPKAKRTKKEAPAEATAGEPVGEPVQEPVQEPTAPSPASTVTAASETVAVATATKAPTYADAAAAITRVVKEMGTPTAKSLLSAFGASNLKGVPEARYAEVIAAAADATVPF
jgi:hypothetical protein